MAEGHAPVQPDSLDCLPVGREEAENDRRPKSRETWRLIATSLLRLLLIMSPVILAGWTAHVTRLNAHPDEWFHVNAFEYFGSHWLRPPLGSGEVLYSVNGISRVYDGEIVYLIYGKIGDVVHHFWPDAEPFHVYRACNVALLLITLNILAFVRCQWFSPWLLALLLISIPQVVYLYSYANSDAFGISASVLLFLHLARMLEQPPRRWSAIRIGIFMLLLLLTLLSKVAFEMDVLLPLALLVVHLVRSRTPLKWIAGRLIVPLLLVYGIASWWNPMISPLHSQWTSQMMAMREQKAIVGRRPSDPQDYSGPIASGSFCGVYMAKHGWTYGRMLRLFHGAWLRLTIDSFYGRFGYMSVALPKWIHATAAYSAIGLVVLTLIALWQFRRRVSWPAIFCIGSAPPLIALNLFGSLYNSLHLDWQPQGRYLFASLVPLFFLCFGTWMAEDRRWRFLHGLALVALVPLSIYVLSEYVALNPTLR